MESKKLGGKMRSSLHKMMSISFSKRSMSSFVMTVEVRFFKKKKSLFWSRLAKHFLKVIHGMLCVLFSA